MQGTFCGIKSIYQISLVLDLLPRVVGKKCPFLVAFTMVIYHPMVRHQQRITNHIGSMGRTVYLPIHEWLKSWWFKVTFLGWLSDPFKGLSDLQLGDEKGTLNHLEIYGFHVGKYGSPMDPMGTKHKSVIHRWILKHSKVELREICSCMSRSFVLRFGIQNMR